MAHTSQRSGRVGARQASQVFSDPAANVADTETHLRSLQRQLIERGRQIAEEVSLTSKIKATLAGRYAA
jgi:hypothetical protein